MKTNRRDFLKTSGIAVAGIAGGLSLMPETQANTAPDDIQADGPFFLPVLNYKYHELEPYIDTLTMDIHFNKHHQAYVTKLNAAIEKEPSLKGKSLEQLLGNIKNTPEAVRADIRNHGGGHWNHSFFWTIMSPGKPMMPEKLSAAISKEFGSVDAFKEQFEKKATSLFGSGWTWLVKDSNARLSIINTANQDNPLMDIAEQKGKPVLGLDVWEHAYYLRNQNRRADYVKSFWNVVNWQKVSELHES